MDLELIKKLLNLPRVKVKDIIFSEKEILVHIYIPPGNHRCPQCGKYHSKITEKTEIKVRDLSIFDKDCYLIIEKGRVNCSCSFRGYEEIEFVDKHQRQTLRFTEYLFMLCDRMTLMDSSELAKVNWNRAYKTDYNTLEALKSSVELPKMTAIGIDEISFEKYHKYFTIVYDLSNGNGVLHVAKDRNSKSLDDFFNQLSEQQRSNIKIVCMDFWDAYIKSIKTHLNHATIVFDRYHLKKHLNDCIDVFRRTMMQQAEKGQKSYIKNKRWILLKNQQNHTSKDKKALEELKNINNPLYEAYLLKEQFEAFYECKNEKQGRSFIENWYQSLPVTIKSFFKPFYKMVIKYIDGVLAYIKYRYTNSVAEGLNNKIKVLKRMAYGYRNETYFQLKILRRCGYLKNIVPQF
jgi:transposase